MRDFIQKNWINALGMGLIFLALLYFMKLAVSNGWFPIELRLSLSGLCGMVALFAGFRLFEKGKQVTGQLLAGFGTAVLYATVGYISFSDEVYWTHGSLLVAMVGISLLVSGVSIRQNQRILYAISIVGGLITPFVIQAGAGTDLPLFIYVMVLNVAALYAGIARGWKENLIIAFLLSTGLFSSYYLLFDPQVWVRPFVYLSSLFALFTTGFLYASNKNERKLVDLELLLGMANGVVYILWSFWIFKSFDLTYEIPMLATGVLYLLIAYLVYRRSDKKDMVGAGAFGALAFVTIIIAANNLTAMIDIGGLKYAFTATLWMGLTALLFNVGKRKDKYLVLISLISYCLVILYWYATAWLVDWVPVFGIKYIPFLNPGALVWIGLIVLGFAFSKFLRNTKDFAGIPAKDASAVLALITHIVVAGLLTVQIMNLWDAYNMQFLNVDLTLSLCWFLYALVLSIWNRKLQLKLFKVITAIVLVVSTGKVVLWDLGNESSVQKIIFLLVLGGITLLIGKMYTNHSEKNTPVLPDNDPESRGGGEQGTVHLV